LWTTLTNCAVSSGTNAETCLVRCVVHLLLGRSPAQIRLVATITNFLDNLWSSMLLHYLSLLLMVATGCLSLELINPLLALSRVARVQNSLLRNLLGVFHGTVRLAYLNVLYRLHLRLLNASLSNLAIIVVVLHLVLINIVSLGRLLLNLRILYLPTLDIRVLYNNLLVLLLDDVLLRILLL